MNVPYQAVKGACNVAITVFLCLFLWEGRSFFRQARQDEAGLSKQATAAIVSLYQPCGKGFPCGIIPGASQAILSANTAIQGLGSTIQTANMTLESVYRPCGGSKPCGTLADINKTLGTVRGTFGQIEVAANHEDKNLAMLDAQEITLFGDANHILGDTDTFIRHFDGLVTSTDVTDTIHNVNAVTYQASNVLEDTAHVTHKFAYPPKAAWYKKVPKLVLQGGELVWDFER